MNPLSLDKAANSETLAPEARATRKRVFLRRCWYEQSFAEISDAGRSTLLRDHESMDGRSAGRCLVQALEIDEKHKSFKFSPKP